MELPVLPAKYYLNHFFELIQVLENHYQPVLEESHRKFLNEFRGLSEDAQCIFVRMINRKGQLFSLKTFLKYKEISNPMKCIAELEHLGFVSRNIDEVQAQLPEFLTKSDLRRWLVKSGFKVRASASREELVELAQENLSALSLGRLPGIEELILQKKTGELGYLLFLYFGKIQRTLSLYALRDLGIRKAGNFKIDFKPRFSILAEAMTEYQLSEQVENYHLIQNYDQVAALLEFLTGLRELTSASQQLKDQLLLDIGMDCEVEEPELALQSFNACQSPPAKERQARMLYKLERKEECRVLLEKIIQDPASDEELLFAEDFLARKFDKKRVGYLTEILKHAQELVLSDYYLRKPERGVRDYYRKKGYLAHFTENYLWSGIFGILFWHELFESEKAAIFNPFERSPSDLIGPEFYNCHKQEIEKKLTLLSDLKSLERYILKTVTQNYGKLNDIFQWHPHLLTTVLEFVRAAHKKDLALVFRTMAQKFGGYHSGYPDLMVVKDGEPEFIEVKAEGDSLRVKQLSKVRLLTEAGFKVAVLKVRWQPDPHQVYVVVDVETTGGSSGSHRVTEIGAVKVQNGVIIDEFQTLLNPGRPIPRNITVITGITDEMVADAPIFSEIAEKFMEFTREAIFVAHNVRFDYGFIQREFQRLDINFVRPLMCTVVGMRKNFPGISSYGLKNLTAHFNISLDQHHRAMCDARATAQLLMMMNEKRMVPLGLPESVTPTETRIDYNFEI